MCAFAISKWGRSQYEYSNKCKSDLQEHYSEKNILF